MFKFDMEERRSRNCDRRKRSSRNTRYIPRIDAHEHYGFEERSWIPDRRLSNIAVEEIYVDPAVIAIMQ